MNTAPALRNVESKPPTQARIAMGGNGGARPVVGELPNPQLWAAHLGQCAVQVLTGQRAQPQLSGWASGRAIAELVEHSPTGLASGQVKSVRCLSVAPNVVEAVVVIDTGVRARALALRMEGLNMPPKPGRRRVRPGPRWVATSLRLL